MRFKEGFVGSDQFREPFHRVDPGKPLDRLRNFLIFRLKQMFELLVMFGNELFGADNPGIREIPGAIPQPAGLGDFEIFPLFLFQYAGVYHFDLAFFRSINRTRMVHVFTITLLKRSPQK